ncbi:glycosyltransferase family A protein [Marinobacter sp. NFXS9]|uniref:glycosyltransferase family 2 protein n=1 Tax=Marinobacter sp. NFXS9 TaxID=2818433 RepID=UPI0032DE7EE2
MRASVIIPSYNAASTLPETIESILPQLTEQDEIIIVDDGSTDNTKDLVSLYLNKRIRYIWQPNSGGPASPRNRGIAAARGEYIFLFDSDDIMLPGKIEDSLAALSEHPDSGLLFTNFKTIDEHGNTLRNRFLDSYSFIKKIQNNPKKAVFRLPAPEPWLYLSKQNFIGTSGVVIPKSIFLDVGYFDEEIQNGDDRDMWFEIAKRYNIIYLSNEYHEYRVHQNSISSGNATKRATNKIKVLERQLKNSSTTKFQGNINREFKLNIRKLISKNYHDIACEQVNSGNHLSALKSIFRSIAHYPSKNSLSLLMKISLGQNLLGKMRKTKKLLKKNG